MLLSTKRNKISLAIPELYKHGSNEYLHFFLGSMVWIILQRLILQKKFEHFKRRRIKIVNENYQIK